MLAIRRNFANFLFAAAFIAGVVLSVRTVDAQAPEAPAAAAPAAVPAVAPAAAPAVAPAPAAAPAPATPKFKEIAFPDPLEWRRRGNTLMAEGKADTPEDKKLFESHFRAAVAEFTQKASNEQLNDKRMRLKRDLNLLGRANDRSLHDALVKDLTRILRHIYSGQEYAPAARVNCLLAYGDLNSEEGDIQARGFVPLAETFSPLVAVFKNTDGSYPAYLQPVALVGIVRHIAKGSTTPEQRRDVVQTLAEWIRTPPSKNVTPEAQFFLRARATEALREIISRTPEVHSPDVVEALFAFAADEKAPLEDRCDAVRTLGMIESAVFPDKNASQNAATLARLAAEVGRQSDVETMMFNADGTPVAMPAATPALEGVRMAAANIAQPGVGNPAGAAAAPVASEPKLHLSPEHQAFLLQSIRAGVSDSAESGKRYGLVATTDEGKQLIAGLNSKINEMLKIVSRKKRSEKLTTDDAQRMEVLAAELEAIFKGQAIAPRDGGPLNPDRAPREVAGIDPRGPGQGRAGN